MQMPAATKQCCSAPGLAGRQAELCLAGVPAIQHCQLAICWQRPLQAFRQRQQAVALALDAAGCSAAAPASPPMFPTLLLIWRGWFSLAGLRLLALPPALLDTASAGLSVLNCRL